MPKIPSKTIHARSFSAISRFFISKSPPGFVGLTSLVRHFFGRSKRQIVSSGASFPGIQQPPTPSPDASTKPRNPGSPMTNSFALVGSHAASSSSILQSWNSSFASQKSFYQIIRGFTCRDLLIGVIKNISVGTAVAECRILHSIFRFV